LNTFSGLQICVFCSPPDYLFCLIHCETEYCTEVHSNVSSLGGTFPLLIVKSSVLMHYTIFYSFINRYKLVNMLLEWNQNLKSSLPSYAKSSRVDTKVQNHSESTVNLYCMYRIKINNRYTLCEIRGTHCYIAHLGQVLQSMIT
jgi:hypothetical protein